MKKTIKQLYNENYSAVSPTGFLFPASGIVYPTIEGNTSNFLTDYNANKEEFDRYFVKCYGERVYDSLEEESPDILAEWKIDVKAILRVYLESWARLYYALSLQYNPLYNVDGTTRTTYSNQTNSDVMGARSESDIYGARDKSDIMGARSESDSYGAKETTNGTRSDNTTSYSVSFDSATEKETGKSVDSIGQQTVTEGQHSDSHTATTYTDRHTEATVTDSHTANTYTDTHNIGTHTETTERFGNIGVTKSSELLESEFEIRKKAFFENIFKVIAEEVGAFYG